MASPPLFTHAQNSNGHLNFDLSAGYTAENLVWSISGKNPAGEPVDIYEKLDPELIDKMTDTL